MSKLVFKYTSLPDLREQVTGLADIISGNPAPPGESLALFSDEELLAELALRSATEAQMPPTQPETAEAEPAVEAAANEPSVDDKPKRGRGRPKKEVAAAAGNGAAPPADTSAAPIAPKPDKAASSVAPDLPDEDDVMALISQVYSSSNDMHLIRTVLQEVGGKTQLSQIPVNLWPALVERLNVELKQLQETHS